MNRSLAILAVSGVLVGTQAPAQTFEAAFASWFASTERAISAVRVDTQQHSVSAQQTAAGANSSMKALASTMIEQSVIRQSRQAINDAESMQTGVSGLCSNVAVAESQSRATTASENVQGAITGFEEDWAANGGSRTEMLAATQDIRRGVLCSRAEMEAGFCDPEAENMTGVVPAGDTNVTPWLLRRSYGTQEAELGSLYVDTIAPPPTIQPLADAQTSVDQLLRRAEARRQMALISIARGAMMDVVVSGMEGGLE